MWLQVHALDVRTMSLCVRLNMAPEDVCAPIPGTSGCVNLHGKRNFANVIAIRILKQGEHPELSRWVQCNHKGAYSGEAGGSEHLYRKCKDKS